MSVTLRHRNGQHELAPQAGENLLYAGLRGGLPLPYECATGTCGSCRARVRNGKVADAWPQAPGKAKLKTEQGDILLCQAHADGPCEILLPGKLTAKPQHQIQPRYCQGQVTHVENLNPEVVTFNLDLDQSFEFLAGQFIALRLAGIAGYRAFSMTRSDRGDHSVSLLVKNLPGGSASARIFADTWAGATVDVFGPLGGAIFRPEEAQHVLCIAGGSGIAGMLAILDHAASVDYFSRHDGYLFFGIRSLEDAFALDLLSELALAHERLEIVVALSDTPPPVKAPLPGLSFEGGFVHEVAIRTMRDRYANTIAYVAGPPIMVDRSLRSLVAQGQLGPDRIRYDKYA